MNLPATLLLLAASANPADAGSVPQGNEQRRAEVATVAVTASARIVRGEAVVFAAAALKRAPGTTVRTDARGVTWVEFT